jgi:hypothetical protein
MTAKVFLDTNILVYAAIGTGKDERKRQRALALIESEEFGTPAFGRTSVGVDRAANCVSLLPHRP